jgi:hypothetical protein
MKLEFIFERNGHVRKGGEFGFAATAPSAPIGTLYIPFETLKLLKHPQTFTLTLEVPDENL